MPTMHHWPHDTELVVDGRKAQRAVRAMTRCLATYAVVLGVAILYGGRARFAGVSYEDALRAPGAPASWGLILLLAGVVAFAGTFLGRPVVTAVGMYLGSAWSVGFAIVLSLAALRHAEADNAGPISCIALGLLFAVSAGVHLAHRTTRVPLTAIK